MVERRNLERFQLNAPAVLTVEGGEQAGQTIELNTRDISAAGAYLLADTALAPGIGVKLEIRLTVDRLHEVVGDTDHVAVTVEGTVIRSEMGGMAVTFSSSYQIRAYGQDYPFVTTR